MFQAMLGVVDWRLRALQGAVQRSEGEVGAAVRRAMTDIRKELGSGRDKLVGETEAVKEAVARVEGKQVELGRGVAAAVQGAADTEAVASALSATLRNLGRHIEGCQ